MIGPRMHNQKVVIHDSRKIDVVYTKNGQKVLHFTNFKM
ncbi:DUF4258 domain-containing protein [Caenorhabditis elegans]|uniref:DUF4258 domain-containing protein n=1 Tax=Caenorhabditis elegans TaxID=6239 RepID=H2L2H0_CAEEL|nr:DUF4258 domain-containing protein [Caenorhabditis elegans]CAB03795.2 DUF4258 domain-containing protein [Caenorhabditis elegans]|eukprot:NP_001263945.1 Uncharacterized protein CELE_B0250.7 [Caenorhabditis elegans]